LGDLWDEVLFRQELTVQPGRSVTIKDAEAYGVIVTQDTVVSAKLTVSTPSMIRFGRLPRTRFFVTASRAREGLVVEI